jgi:hypothetical protein
VLRSKVREMMGKTFIWRPWCDAGSADGATGEASRAAPHQGHAACKSPWCAAGSADGATVESAGVTGQAAS